MHTLIGTAANVNDVTQAGALLHGQETSALGDAGYGGVHKRPHAKVPKWFVALQRGRRKPLDLMKPWARMLEQAEQIKASIRAKVEHPFRVLKRQFGLTKVRYRGLKKNTAPLFTLFALAKLVIAKGPVLERLGQEAP